jgi:hypothetical protein
MPIRHGAPTAATPDTLAALVAKYRGKKGDPDAESSLMTEKSKPGTVLYYTSRGADIGWLVKRCGSAVVQFWDCGGSVTLEIRTEHDGRRVFRGLQYAFAPIDNDNTGKPFPGSQERNAWAAVEAD